MDLNRLAVTGSLCTRRAVMAALCVMAIIFLLPVRARAFDAAQVGEVYVYGQGTGIYGTINGEGTVNGNPTPTFTNPPNPNWMMQGVTLPGNPGVVTSVITLRGYNFPGGDLTNYHTDPPLSQFTFTYDVNTGAVTVSGTGLYLGDTITVTANGVTLTQPVVGGAFNIAFTVTPSFSNPVCVTFPNSLVGAVYPGLEIVDACSFFVVRPIQDQDTPGALDDPAFVDLLNALVEDNYINAFRMMTDQFSNNMMQQAFIIGTLLDAKHQMETQRLFGEIRAQAHKDYQPSEQVCAFGSIAKYIPPISHLVTQNMMAVNTAMTERELLARNTAASQGFAGEKLARLRQFATTYCDPGDNNADLAFCNSATPGRRNNDIDYTRMIDRRMTLDVNFTDGVLSNDEADIIALSKNLYAHDILPPIAEREITMGKSQHIFMDARSLTARRGLARYSFASIIGQKAAGTGIAAGQLRGIMTGLGVEGTDVNLVLGQNPSYFAMMDVITQKMYQDSSFFLNLYDKPANVDRIGVALQAVRLMHGWDTFEEALRREMLISGWLETLLRAHQTKMVNETGKLISQPNETPQPIP